MSDKVYIGSNASELDYGNKLTRISRVNLTVDSDHFYTSGDDTGRTLEVDCPWGSQEMADSILAKVSAVDYQPYTAEQTILDPAAEIGDGVTVGGIYSQISTSNIEFDKMCVSDISAPESDEIDDEYPYESGTQRAIERKIAYTRSLITKTSAEISLKVEDMENSLSQTLRVASDGVTITNAAGDTLTIDGGQINASTINTAELDATKINVGDLQLDGAITWADLANDVQRQVTTAQDTADEAAATVSAWQYGSTAYIDGTMLMIGTVTATKLMGGSVSILTSENIAAGVMTVTGADTASFAIDLTSYGALRLTANSGAAYISSGGYGTAIMCSDYIYMQGNTTPISDDDYTLGASDYRWATIYATTGTIQTSDRNYKYDIESLPDKYLDMLVELPVYRFKMDGGESGRYHVGYIAQDVEEYMAKHGIESSEFGGFVKATDKKGNKIYMLRYEEFIAIHTLAIQRIYKRLEEAGI